jgi:L-asparagine transporter-like permease
MTSEPSLPPASGADREHGLQQTLSTGQLSMIAIGGAIGTGLFLGSAFAIGFAGPAVLVSYAIGGIISLLLMGCLAEMAVAKPVSGAFGTYAELYLGSLAGFLVRYAYWSANVLAIGTEISAVALYMQYWFPTVPGGYWIGGFALALVAVNAGNVRMFGSVEYAFSAFKIAAIVVFLLLGAYLLARAPAGSGIGFGNYTAHGGFLPNGVWGMWVAVIVALFSYLSIEMIAVAAGEARDPQRAIVRAFRATVFRLLVFYLFTLVLILAIVPWNTAGTAGSPFVKVMAATRVPWASGLVNLVVLVAALSAMNSQLYVTTRMLFSLSRAGQAPRRFGRLSARGVPVPALLLSCAGIAIAAVVHALVPDSAFLLMVSISIFGALFTWLMIFVTHLSFRRAHPAPAGFRMWGYPYTSLAGALLILAVLATTAFTPEFRMTLIYGIPFRAVLALAWRAGYRPR